jgi:hypothetical protein
MQRKMKLGRDEEDGSEPAGIGIGVRLKTEDLHACNYWIIRAWLTYAGRYEIKTIVRSFRWTVT